ncbi:MAG: molybdate ABC transporter substrate-binding protein [Gammaproteobacteria bacterium]
MKKLFTGLVLSLTTMTVAAETLQTAVATNFRPTLEIIAEKFREQTGHEIALSAGSTGQLYAQITQGAPFDLFFAADDIRPEKLEADDLATDRFTYAIGQLALCSAQTEISDEVQEWLKNEDIKRLAIANPRLAPYGRAAREFIEASDSTDKFAGRLIRGENIGQTFQFVITGNVTAGLVAESQRLRTAPEKLSCKAIPAQLHEPIIQQAVILNNTSTAQAFMDFVRSPAIRTIIMNAGYDLPDRD